jgi:hypothetical protein
VTTCKLNLDLTVIADAPFDLAVNLSHDPNRKKTRCIPYGWHLLRRKARVTQICLRQRARPDPHLHDVARKEFPDERSCACIFRSVSRSV